MLDINALAGLPAADVLILTVNNRLARTITSELAARARQTNQAVELPRIEPFSGWLAAVAFDRSFEGRLPGVLLDAAQAQMVWADVIGQLSVQEPLVDVQQAANLAQQADALVLEWEVELALSAQAPDHRRFVQWRQAYERRLQALNALDPPRLARRVADWLREGSLVLPSHVVMAGFADLSPMLQQIQDLLEASGARVHRLALAQTASVGQGSVVPCLSVGDQWLKAVCWARERLTAKPDGLYAIVAPLLQSQAALAKRVLARDLGFAFNIAVAPPLAQWSQGRALLAWLGLVVGLLVRGSVQVADAGAALLAGHCAGVTREASARALLDARWRRLQITAVTASRWQSDVASLPELSAAWREVRAIWLDRGRGTRSWFEWASRFRATLAALGFPGDQAQTSVQFQTLQALDGLLSRLASLDELLTAPSVHEAQGMLARLAARTPFQPQRDREARLDVLGLLEAEGGRWDGVWVMDMTDQVLPAQPDPNPLLSAMALAQAGAPRSTPARELQWAQRNFAGLRGLAPEVVFSWPLHDGEMPNRASPFLLGIPADQTTDLRPAPAPSPWPMHVWSDEPEVPLRAGESVGGGVDLLETQAANPQWAFFRYRLRTRGLPAHAQVPVQSLPRGNLLHAVVRDVWEDLGDHAALTLRWSTPAWQQWLGQRVTFRAESILAELPPVLRELEVKRTLRVLHGWLALEAARPPFQVLQKEQPYDWAIGPLTLKVTLDRLDQLADDSLLLIDYKTSRELPKPARWSTQQLRDIQLLVYASVLQDQGMQPDALAWYGLHEAGVRLQGLARSAIGIDGLVEFSPQAGAAPDWSAQLALWRVEVQALGQSFVDGSTENRFWHRLDAQYCDLRPLLRLHAEPDDE